MRAIFLDKDGTLIEDVPFNVDPDQIRLAPHAGAALRLLQRAGYALIVVSNQSGIARGLFAESALIPVRQRIDALLREHGVEMDGFRFCPHHPDGLVARYAVSCECRKPRPGMLIEAALELGIDLPDSWIVGDILDDVEAGSRAGCRSVLIDNGNETEWVAGEHRRPDLVAAGLLEAALAICDADASALPLFRSLPEGLRS